MALSHFMMSICESRSVKMDAFYCTNPPTRIGVNGKGTAWLWVEILQPWLGAPQSLPPEVASLPAASVIFTIPKSQVDLIRGA